MSEPRVFVNYGIPFSSYKGRVSLNEIPREQQDELIRTVFDPNGDMHSFVMDRDIVRSEPQGLWSIVLAVGSLLEERGAIANFDQRTASENQRIVIFLLDTDLGQRLKAAFDKSASSVLPFDWRRLAPFEREDFFDDCETLADLKRTLQAHLGTRATETIPSTPHAFDPFGMSYEHFSQEYEAGRLSAFVDRGLAVQAYQLSNNPLTLILPFMFLAGLISFIPLMVFFNVWSGVAALIIAVAAKRLLTIKAVSWVRHDALSNKSRFEWYKKHRVVWGERVAR